MNILFTSVGNFLTLEANARLREWKRHHIVEQMPMEGIISYLRIDPASALALVPSRCHCLYGRHGYTGPQGT